MAATVTCRGSIHSRVDEVDKIKAAARLLHHLDKINVPLLQAFHDSSGMLRARHEHEMPHLAPCCTLVSLRQAKVQPLQAKLLNAAHVAPVAQTCAGQRLGLSAGSSLALCM